jgi:uncharacterized protein with beta-barrel porin domain
MMNKANNTLVLATVDSLNKFKKLGSTALATTLVATSIFTNAANADNVGNGVTHTSDAGTDYIFNANTKDLDINTSAIMGVNVGDITDNSITGDIDIITAADSTTAGNATITIGSITMDAGTTAGVMSITDAANETGNLTVNITGNLVHEGTLTVTTLEATDDELLTVDVGGTVNITGAVELVAGGSGIDGDISMNVSGAAVTFTAGIDLADVSTTGSSTLQVDGAVAQTVTGAIDGDGAGEGTLIVDNTHASGATIATALGGNARLKLVNVSASDSTATFAATVASTTVTNLGTTVITGAISSDTINNTGTLTMTAATDGIAGDFTTVNLKAQGATVLFNGTGAVDMDTIVAADTDGFGTLNFIDSDDNAASTNTTSGGDIGADTKRIGTINIGSATKAGNLTTINDDAIFASAINITGGNVDAEDSILDLHENIGDADDLVAIVLTDNAGDAELDVGTVSTVFGTIDGTAGTAGAGSSTIDANAALTVSGNIGATNAVEALEIGDTTTLKGVTNNITATTFTADDVLNISGTAAQTLTSTLTATNEQGELNIVNATHLVTIAGTVGAEAARLKEIDIADNATTKFSNAVFTLALDVNTAAAADVTTWTIGNVIGDDATTAGTMDVVGGTFVLDTAVVDGTTVFDTREVLNNDSGVELRGLVIQPSANFTAGTVTFLNGATAANIDAEDVAGVSVTDTALTDFTVNITAAVADVTITAAAKSGSATGTALGVTTNQGTAIHELMAAAIAADATVLTALNDNLTAVNGGTLSVATDLAKQTAPQTDTATGSSLSTRAMTGTVQGIVSNRMASLRSGDAYVTGMSAGNGMSAQSAFIQAFGSEAEQKNTGPATATVYGYDSETSGVAIGFDGMTDTGETIGLSASFSTTDVDGKGTGKSKNSIDSYTVSLYGDKATDYGYMEGSLTYGINDNNSSRLVNTAGLDRTYSGNYDSQQLSIKVGGGAPNEVSDGTFVTPFTAFTGTFITTDAYTETSTTASDALRLKVAQDDITSLVATVGVKAHKVTDNGTPMISFAINNEFGDSAISSKNTYQGGGTAFTTSTAVEELTATLGVGYSFGNDMTSLNLNYEANTTQDEDYMSHYGSVKVVAKF